MQKTVLPQDRFRSGVICRSISNFQLTSVQIVGKGAKNRATARGAASKGKTWDRLAGTKDLLPERWENRGDWGK